MHGNIALPGVYKKPSMFKKKPTVKALAPLRSSDRRKLADQIIKEYELEAEVTPANDAEQTPEAKAEIIAARTALRSSLFPDNIQTARFTTTYGPGLKPASGTLYVGAQDGHEARVLWFHFEGRTYPSVYTLWRNPGIIPLLHTPDIVVKKLQGGADLMTPGLANGPPFPPRAKKGSVVAVAALEKPSVPMAVGQCEVDVSALTQVRGAKGLAVENVHWVGDELWSYSTTSRPGQEPPDDLEGWIQHDSPLTAGVEELTMEEEDGDGGGVSITQEAVPEAQVPAQEDVDEFGGSAQEQELSQKEIDEAFRNAFLYGIHHHKTTGSPPHFGLNFPITQSAIMSTLIQPFLPAFTAQQAQQLQIKKTTWKNIKKFVKTLDKEKLVKSKESNGHETVIMDIDFDDASIKSFKPYRLPKKETAASTTNGRGDAAIDKISTGDDALGQKLKITTFYKPTNKLQPLFDAASASKTHYTPPEVRDLINTYVESESLVSETNKRLVKLNPILANAIFDGSGSLDKEVVAKGSVPRDALVDRILHAMNTSYAILRNGADPSSVKAKSGLPPKILITLETRSGNKTVTKLSGVEAFHISPRPLADELRKTCAGSTSIEPLVGAAKKDQVMEVMIQGPQQDAVTKALEKRGVDKRWIEVMDKTKGKKR